MARRMSANARKVAENKNNTYALIVTLSFACNVYSGNDFFACHPPGTPLSFCCFTGHTVKSYYFQCCSPVYVKGSTLIFCFSV